MWFSHRQSCTNFFFQVDKREKKKTANWRMMKKKSQSQRRKNNFEMLIFSSFCSNKWASNSQARCSLLKLKISYFKFSIQIPSHFQAHFSYCRILFPSLRGWFTKFMKIRLFIYSLKLYSRNFNRGWNLKSLRMLVAVPSSSWQFYCFKSKT